MRPNEYGYVRVVGAYGDGGVVRDVVSVHPVTEAGTVDRETVYYVRREYLVTAVEAMRAVAGRLARKDSHV